MCYANAAFGGFLTDAVQHPLCCFQCFFILVFFTFPPNRQRGQYGGSVNVSVVTTPVTAGIFTDESGFPTP